jgi:hypothetical protein
MEQSLNSTTRDNLSAPAPAPQLIELPTEQLGQVGGGIVAFLL